MYGFSISKEGILTDKYYKKIDYKEKPPEDGAYVMIMKIGNELRLYQDFYGSFGLYYYENANVGYFAISNSFLLLEEYLIDKQNISLNKEFCDNFIISKLCSPSIYETMIKEITKLPSNIIIIININKRNCKFYYIDYKENSIPLESEEGMNIIDKWVDKWGYIFRSLQKKTKNFSFDLSGGYDTRTVFAILIASGIDLNKVLIKSAKDKKNPCHEEDFQIATNISLKYGFKLNDLKLDNRSTIWSTKDALSCSIYTKLGFHKEFYLKPEFYYYPRFVFTGNGGENLRGYPGYPIEKYLDSISSQGAQITKYKDIFYNSSMKICNRSLTFLKKLGIYENKYEISTGLYSKGRTRNHCGTAVIEGFLANIYLLQPLIDHDIKKIKFKINGKYSHDLISYIYVRFAHDLIYYPFQGNRSLNSKSIEKAEKLNSLIKPYKIKSDFNEDFFIDLKRKSPAHSSISNKNVDVYLKELFKTTKFIKTIGKIYNKDVYDWAKKYSKISNFFPLRHGYSLFAVATTVEYLSLNEIYMKKKLTKNITFKK